MSESRGQKGRIEGLEAVELTPETLVGSFFHTYGDDETVQWQGCVVARPADGLYLVELFSWVAGESTEQRLVRVDDMLGWSFYDDSRWMKNRYEYALCHRRPRDEKSP